MRTKTFTLGQLVDAIEKNGYNQAYRSWIDYNSDGSVHAACALGQAALNLGVPLEEFQAGLDEQKQLFIVLRKIFTLNDINRYDLPNIARLIRAQDSDLLDVKFKVKVPSLLDKFRRAK